MVEEWRAVMGYEGLYEVSSDGRVRSLNYRGVQGRIEDLSPGDKGGYLAVVLYSRGVQQGRLVHRLVAQAFLDNPLELPEVNHIDENPSNNHVSNLEWCTRTYNINFGSRIERVRDSLSQGIEAFNSSGQVIHRFSSTMEAQRNGFHSSHISSCCRGLRRSHKGLHWRYV